MLNKYKEGYKKFEKAANLYVKNPKKTASLIRRTAKKAKENKGSLTDIWEKFQLLIDLVRSWSKGEYTNISNKSIVFIIASILYFVSPIDLVPDFLAGIGIMDDAAVLAFALKQISGELEKYKEWKQKQPIDMQ